MAYAAADPEIHRVISIAGNDLGWLIRKMKSVPQYSEAMLQMLLSTRAPDGPVRHLSNKSLPLAKPLVTHLAFARPAPITGDTFFTANVSYWLRFQPVSLLKITPGV